MPFGIYLHIPYCSSRCRYCNFYTHPGFTQVPQNYIDALIASYQNFRLTHQGAALPLQPDTVYFGGGTPGLLSAQQVEQLLSVVNPVKNAEITLEANPVPGLAPKLAGWYSAGINRLSLGVQTADDQSLKRLGRLHTAADATQAFQAAQKAGFTNISGDIMLALPSYSYQEFDQTLDLLESGGAVNISAYLLKIEPQTAFGKKEPACLPTPDQASDYYLYAVEKLAEKGYQQVEISNFAKTGFAGRHNLLYWNCQDYLGLGPGAHSSIGSRRFSVPEDLPSFLQHPSLTQEEGTVTGDDYIMLRLRLTEGLDETILKNRFGQQLTQKQKQFFTQLAGSGYATRNPQTQNWRLTPSGMLVQNAILSQLL